jgi:hypothetical protein
MKRKPIGAALSLRAAEPVEGALQRALIGAVWAKSASG